MIRSALVLAPLLALGCATAVVDDVRGEPDPRQQEYVIGPADLLRVTVWKNPELSTEARVRPDGTITMPLIGDVRAGGRTPSDLNREVTQRLADYVTVENRRVTVAVAEVNSYRFSVTGNVEHGGVFNPRNYVTVAEAIALAGGLSRFATPERLVLLRGERPQRRLRLDYTRIVSGDHPEENLVLLPGDTLHVN